MSRHFLKPLPLALASAALLGAAPAFADRIFYVDYASGSDAATGLSPAAAWKHAPGDLVATGVSKAMKLLPGDTLRFRGGVRYRGAILLKTTVKGTKEKPIVFDGSSWGPTKAVLDGSSPLPPAAHCRSAAECLGAPNWRQLMRVSIPAGSRYDAWLFANDTALMPAQWPSTAFWDYDNVDLYATIPSEVFSSLANGYVGVAIPASLKAGTPVLALWNATNDITHTSNITIGASGITFVSDGFKPYQKNGISRFAIMNTPMAIDAPGKYAISPKDGIAVFYPLGAAQLPLSLAAHRHGFNMVKSDNVIIRGFSFANFATRNAEFGSSTISGAPIVSTSGQNGITIIDNNFRSISTPTKGSIIRIFNATNVLIKRNSFTWSPYASAISVSYTNGSVAISCNNISYIGRTGISMYSALEGNIIGNRISHLAGIHGNGISIYLDNRHVIVDGNIITDTGRPITAHGIGNSTPRFASSEPVNIQVRNNVFLSNSPGSAAFSSWAKGLHNVTFTNNILANPKYAVRMTGGEQNIVFTGNQIVGGFSGAGMATPTGANSFYDPAGNGAAIVAAAAARTVSSTYCQ